MAIWSASALAETLRPGLEIRLADFYAPELSDPGGLEARAALASLTMGKRLVCTATRGSNGRTYNWDRLIAMCTIRGERLAICCAAPAPVRVRTAELASARLSLSIVPATELTLFLGANMLAIPWLKTIGDAASSTGRAVRKRIPITFGLLAWGLGFVVAGVLLEQPTIKSIVVSLTTKYVGPVGGHYDSSIFTLKSFVSLLKEIGFALIIAWGVSSGIERRARERDEEHVEQTRGRIAQDVVHAVYGLQHDANYVRAAIEQTLRSKVVRDFFDCQYILEELTEQEEAELEVAPGRFVKLTQISKYTFTNVSSDPVVHTVGYSLAARHGKKFREFACIRQMSFNDVKLEDHEISLAELPDDPGPNKSYGWTKTIAGRQSLSVVVIAVSLKELSDNEVWGNQHPTVQGMDLGVDIKIKGMRYGVRTLTSTKAQQTFDYDGKARWSINGPILPNDSVVFWWRVPEDDGEPTAAV